MKPDIFKRIFILYAVLMILALIVVELYVTAAVKNYYIDNLRKDLVVQISLISKRLSFKQVNADSLCREIKKDTGARVTLIADDGRVIGDSDKDSAQMDNHLHRTEIEQATLFDTGMTIRFSDTLNYDFLYVAKKVSLEDESGFIRLAVPLREIGEAVNLLRMKIMFSVGVVLLLTWIVSFWQTNHLRRLLHQITEFSQLLSRGEIEKRLFLRNAGEFNEIADNLTAMSSKLQGMIAQTEEEKSRLNVILKSVPDALLIIDARGVITLSSQSAKEFFGDAPMAGKQFVDVVRNHEFSELVSEVRKSLLPGMTEFRIDYPVEKFLSVRVSPLFYKGQELSGFVAIFHDVTQIEKLEQVRKDFVANVSHELKTPITAIKGFADTLLEGAVDDKEHALRFIQTIKSNSERINSLVDDLMTISKIELGVIKVEKSLIDVTDVFETVTELFRDKAKAKDLFLQASPDPDILQINADKNRLIQILTNLVDNAVKFTDKGGVTIGTEKNDDRAVIFVEDTGMGVPGKYLQRLGERFFRVDPARSRKMGGTGLGLAIVKHLIKAHGWTMQIESVYGQGTKVSIFIS